MSYDSAKWIFGQTLPAADDGHALEPGERDGEGDADVGAHPEESARGGHGRHVDGALRLRHLARRQHLRQVSESDVCNLACAQGLCWRSVS